MYQCNCCVNPKVYSTRRSLYRHQRKYDPSFKPLTTEEEYNLNPLRCLNCNKVITYEQKKARNRYCSGGCAATINNKVSPKRKRLPSKNCIQCGKEFRYRPGSHSGLFCGLECFQLHRWENVTKPRIERGEGGPYSTKKYLLETCEQCSECGQGSVWNGKPLTLHLDHIDGNSDNNILSNVRILCPNCHTQTPNYGIKNAGQNSRRNLQMRRYRSKIAL